MRIATQSFQAPQVQAKPAQVAPATSESAPEVQDTVSHSHSELKNNLKLGAVSAVCGALGYAGSVAHAIPFAGPAISGIAGAIVGASAGAAIATKMPGEPIKAGAVLGLVGGAILGASGGGNPATSAAMAVAGATVPFGLLVAVMSGAS